MTHLQARVADVVLNRLADYGIAIDREIAGSVAASVSALPGIAIVELPEPDERLPADSVLIQWLDAGVSTVRGSQRVRCYLEDHRLAATEAHDIAAALLAAAVQAQEEQP